MRSRPAPFHAVASAGGYSLMAASLVFLLLMFLAAIGGAPDWAVVFAWVCAVLCVAGQACGIVSLVAWVLARA